MAHPDFEPARQAMEQGRFREDVNFSVAVLPSGRRFYAAAQMVHDELQSITDAEDRETHLQQFRIGVGRVRVIDRAWSSRENEALRFERADLFQRDGAGKYYGKNIELADASGDELGVL